MTKECEKCGNDMDVRYGYDGTRYCDNCAHEQVEKLRGDVEKLTAALQGMVDRSGGFRGEVPFDGALREARATLKEMK